MELVLKWQQKQFRILPHPLSIAIPLRAGEESPNAFFLRQPEFQTVRIGTFIGSVAEGGSCNCRDVIFNPHGNGTHTECLGHITSEPITIAEVLHRFHFVAQLCTVTPQQLSNGDYVIAPENLPAINEGIEALVIRTLPNTEDKQRRVYSGTNPPYFLPETTAMIREAGVQHLLVDLPSLDREEDGGQLLAHKAFWQYPQQPRKEATVTEMIYVPSAIPDGIYWLNLQVPAFALDAAPSRPVLYPLEEIQET